MPIQVFDFRTDIRNLDITPEIRSRFLRFEPGTVANRHSHDLGHEVFLILAGQADFEIEGEHAVLGPGQYCFARVNQLHQVRVVGDEPVIMYLSVTPHIEPTHTQYNKETWERLPPRYNPPTTFDKADTLANVPTADLADRHLAAVRGLTEVVQTAAATQASGVAALKEAAAADDPAALKAAMDAIWEQVYATYQALNAMADAWNDLAPRAAGRPYGR